MGKPTRLIRLWRDVPDELRLTAREYAHDQRPTPGCQGATRVFVTGVGFKYRPCFNALRGPSAEVGLCPRHGSTEPGQRRVRAEILARFDGGESHQDIADDMDITPSRVRQMIFRAERERTLEREMRRLPPIKTRQEPTWLPWFGFPWFQDTNDFFA